MDQTINRKLIALTGEIYNLSLKIGAFENALIRLNNPETKKLIEALITHKNALSAAYKDLALFVRVDKEHGP